MNMAEDPDILSEGSDIDADSDEEFEAISGDFCGDRVGAEQSQQWLEYLEEEDLEDDFEGFQGEWKFHNFRPRLRHDYRRQPGPKVPLCRATSLEAFSSIFDEAIWERLVDETNRYAEQQRQTPAKSDRWSPVSSIEMKTFVGLCLTMGVMRLPRKRDFWRRTKWLYRTQFPDAMSRDRFLNIWRYLHLENNQGSCDKSDKLWKVRWFLSHLKENFQATYEVNGFVTVDESMVKYKGRLPFRQYLPIKPIKWGVKVWVMAESSTGYVTNFQVYTGREGLQEKGLSHRVVMDLAAPYFGTHLTVFMDNFYTGPELLCDLGNHGIEACGTVRRNRKGLPTTIMPKRGRAITLGRHQYRVAQKDELTFCVWQDTKPVMVLSNFHNPLTKGFVKRKTDDNTRVQVEVPSSLADYQENMKGVDLLDQMVGYYMFQHKSKKWWRRLFFFFLTVSCYNTYVAARSAQASSGAPDCFKEWLENLTLELVTTVTAREATQAPHQLRPVPDHDCDKLFSKRKTCKECSLSRCSTDARASATIYGCIQCNEAVHIECFGKHVRRHLQGAIQL